MTFNQEQLTTLSQYESNFRTAVNARWAMNPGRSALRLIYDIFTQATGDRRRFSDNCSTCILSLLQDCGAVYFKDKEELSKKVEISQEAAEPLKKVEVKTTKKTTKKAKK